MNKYLTLVLAILFSTFAFADDYIIVAVSGLRTIREKSKTEDVLSNQIDKSGEVSGVWSNAPTKEYSAKINYTAYLTHFSKDSEINSVLQLFLDENKICKNNVRMILMVNSWGAKVSQVLSKKYEKLCGSKPLMSFMIEGISKPTPSAYTKDLISEECINIFQTKSNLHGDRINNCKNFVFTYPNQSTSLFNSHLETEWHGGELAKDSILKFLSKSQSKFTINIERFSREGLTEL
ncbi:MAG: hypothetical protein K2Q18_15315 [Bdellovibrionales bacterium]|nr:hypothetical protein [Bdellovibrionales bacterium]